MFKKKDTFKRVIRVPVSFELTDELETDVVCAAEYHFGQILEEQKVTERFFGWLEGLVKEVKISVTTYELKFIVIFDKRAKQYEEEIDEQMLYVVHYIIRPLLDNCEIPTIDTRMTFTSPVPYSLYKRNAFLDELGLKPDSYGTNFISADDKRRECWINESLKYGFDNRETWNMHTVFIEWLYSHLKMYTSVSIVDMDKKSFIFKIIDVDGNVRDVEMAMTEAVNIIMSTCEEYLTFKDNSDINDYKKMLNKMQYALRIWAEVFPAFWW